MSDLSNASIPRPRPELLAESWTKAPPEDDPRAAGKSDLPRRSADAVLRRVRKRGKLIRRRSMPLLGGLLLVTAAPAKGGA